jgi:multidrug resistance efflux pump
MKRGTRNSHTIKRFYLRHAVPVTVWVLAVTVVVWLFYQRSARFETLGMARGQVRQVAASSTGRIKEIHVKLFDPVKEGQPVVVIDTVAENEQVDEAKLRTQFATAAAEAERLSAELIPTQEKLRVDAANRQMNQQDNWRRFEMDVDSARLRILDLQATLASQRVTLDDLALQAKKNQELLKDEAIVPFEVERIQVRYDAVLKNVRENEQLLEQAQAVLQQAQQRRDEFTARELPEPSEDAALEAIRKQIGVQEQAMKGLLEQLAAWKSRHAVELRSPIDGRVISIHGQRNDTILQRPGEEVLRRPGEVVRAGDPILVVAETEPNEVVAYVNEQQLGYVKEGMPVELVRTRTPAKIAQSQVVQVGPTVEPIPQRLWRNPNIPQWGRPVLIRIPTGLDLVPGEVVGIRGL